MNTDKIKNREGEKGGRMRVVKKSYFWGLYVVECSLGNCEPVPPDQPSIEMCVSGIEYSTFARMIKLELIKTRGEKTYTFPFELNQIVKVSKI